MVANEFRLKNRPSINKKSRPMGSGKKPSQTANKAPRVRPIIIGNWKMNGLKVAAKEIRALDKAAKAAGKLGCDMMICPPATLISTLSGAAKGTKVAIGSQDCHSNASGAHTGDISAEMVKDLGGKGAIVGHSERRTDHGESDALVRAKANAAHSAGIIAIVCVGETEKERDSGKTLRVIGKQVKGSLPETITARNTIVAYEPVWAIGTGRTPTNQEVGEVHSFIRAKLKARYGAEGEKIRILYGGSMKPANAADLLSIPHVNGGLVGGASLKAKDFFGIISAC
jgi:triosephosphate isomerase (TIM)